MASRTFLKKLLLKLKTGNSRSIHLNALPGRSSRLDLYELINIDQGLHLKFINSLLGKPGFRFKISVDFKSLHRTHTQDGNPDATAGVVKLIMKKLDGLFYQQQDEFLEHGTRTFAFGYPLLIKRDLHEPKRILKAPLIIWYLDIDKDLHKSNTWTISRNEDHPVIFNEVLRSHMESRERIRMEDLVNELDVTAVDEQSVINVCRSVIEETGDDNHLI